MHTKLTCIGLCTRPDHILGESEKDLVFRATLYYDSVVSCAETSASIEMSVSIGTGVGPRKHAFLISLLYQLPANKRLSLGEGSHWHHLLNTAAPCT